MTDPEPTAAPTPFWRFSLHFYRQAGVAEACIALQDESGVDVNLLLFLLWLAAGGRRLTADEVRGLDDRVRSWRELTIIPLRALRRELKGRPTVVEAGKQEAFRSRVKAAELEAERLQQEALYALAIPKPPGASALPAEAGRANVAAYEHVLARRFPPPAVATLLGAFDGIDRRAFAPGAA
jgi:uncharacterized protein (TIGR02444 family)